MSNGRYVHGLLTRDAFAQRRQLRALMQAARDTIAKVEEMR